MIQYVLEIIYLNKNSGELLLLFYIETTLY